MQLQEAGEVKVLVYNMNAELVARVQADLPVGRGELIWDCRSAASGVYMARVYIGNKETKKIKVAVLH